MYILWGSSNLLPNRELVQQRITLLMLTYCRMVGCYVEVDPGFICRWDICLNNRNNFSNTRRIIKAAVKLLLSAATILYSE